uniref:Arabinogalactan peptide 16 n=2 Tax=Brassica TaxID=3705 RepID=A0A0D3B6Z3_BRAOL
LHQHHPHTVSLSSFSIVLSADTPANFLFRRIKTPEREMASRSYVAGFALFTFVFAVISSLAGAQSLAPAPAPTSDGTSIDQGIAYLLMVLALVLTYLIHPLDASSSYGFF